MRNFFRLCPFLLAAALMFGAGPAFAGKRVALVLANSAYQHAPSLANPVNDGAVMAKTLKDAGFDVVDSRHDLTALDTRRVLRDFADSTRDADIAVVYYAGHGIEVEGSNYLIAVDAKLERDTDVYDEALSLDRVLVAVEPAKQLRLVILDACRDNPFGRTMKRTLASRGIGRGLAQVEPASSNTLIAYSAKAGFTQHPDGFYANLAKLQLDKIQTEQVHAAATEKAKQAEADRDRLAALGAQRDAQAKAAADAKAAEQAQLAAQKAKEQAQQQAAAAEQQRVNLAAARAGRCARQPGEPRRHQCRRADAGNHAGRSQSLGADRTRPGRLFLRSA